LIILHPRTAKEKFKRLARWDYVGALRAELGIPVAGNGDIETAEGLISRSQGPCDAVMVGRAAVRQPWIFAQGKGKMGNGEQGLGTRDCYSDDDSASGLHSDISKNHPQSPVPSPQSLDFLEETGLRFLELLGRFQPPEFHLSRARRFFGFFCDNLKWGNYLKTLLNREDSLAGIERVWQGHFRGDT
jgi:tRNA-dihydrouridine synthase